MSYPCFGPVKVFLDIINVLEILMTEGFESTLFQAIKPGQRFGLIKNLGQDLDMHVRMYSDSSLDSEIELSREYLEHPGDCRPFYGPLFEILQHYHIPYQITQPIPPDPTEIFVPEKKTPWKPLVVSLATILIGSSLIWLGSLKEQRKPSKELLIRRKG